MPSETRKDFPNDIICDDWDEMGIQGLKVNIIKGVLHFIDVGSFVESYRKKFWVETTCY